MANKHAYGQIERRREDVEAELGAKVHWERLDNRQASRVSWHWDQSVTVLDPANKLEPLKTWAVDSYFKFRDAFSKILADLAPMEPPKAPPSLDDATPASEDSNPD